MDIKHILRELEEQGIRNDAEQTEKSKKYLNITRDTGEFLSLLVKAIKAKTILEVGTSNGYSTLWLASSLPADGHVYTIEKLEEKAREAQLNFSRAGLQSRITQLIGDASQALTDIPGEVDFIFLDADRSQYMNMAESLFGLLRSGGLLVCDNAVSHQHELVGFVNWIKTKPNLSISLVPVGKGELLVYKDEN